MSSARVGRGEALLLGGYGASAVLLGAAGAHLLAGRLDAGMLGVWHTAVQYQFWHTLALAAALLGLPRGASLRRMARDAFAAGMLLFCGSLYALALGAPRAVGLVTPLGGIALAAGWVALALAAARARG